MTELAGSLQEERKEAGKGQSIQNKETDSNNFSKITKYTANSS